jgi:hypothetical protein
MSTFYGNYPVSGSASGGSNPSVGANGSPAPTDSTEVGFVNGSGDLTAVSPSTPLPVTIESEVGTLSVNLTEVGGAAIALGQTTMSASLPVAIASNQSTLPISAASLPLPTGAATSANQSTEITALGTINTTLGSPFQAGGSIANTSFIATQATGTNLHTVVDNFPATQPVSGTVAVTQSTSPWIVAGGGTAGVSGTAVLTVQGIASGTAIPISGSVTATPSVNTNGSAANSTTVANTSATTFSAPGNAVGFVVEAESSNTVNLRYACGTTATNSVGMLLEPGRDSGYIPSKGTVTVICATTGTGQAAGIQWVLSS